jgi:hypothetical protein
MTLITMQSNMKTAARAAVVFVRNVAAARPPINWELPPNVPDNPSPFPDWRSMESIRKTQMITKNTLRNIMRWRLNCKPAKE